MGVFIRSSTAFRLLAKFACVVRIPKAPTELSPAARAEWDRLAAELCALGMLTNLDRAALAAYCGAYPPRTIIEVHRLNQDDIFEVEGTFYSPVKR